MFTIPRSSVTVLRQGDRGVVVWAFQRTCERLSIPIAGGADGEFQDGTTVAAKTLQIKLGFSGNDVDGIVGPQTQRALAEYLCHREETITKVPDNILLSQVLYESDGYLGAVNWSVAGGVDVGIAQRRVYATDYDDEQVIMRAFDAAYQIDLVAARDKDLKSIYLARGVIRKVETAYRCAVLAHNYPSLADRISRDGFKGLSSYWTSVQGWTLQRNPDTDKTYYLKFPDGHEIKTPLEWGQRYSLGNPEHNEPGQAVKFVDWEHL